MKKKLLMTASSFNHIRSFHLPYLERFKELGWEVHVAAGGEVGEVPYADCLIPLPMEKRYLSLKNARCTGILRKWMKEQRYTLVITHTALASFYTRAAEIGLSERPKTINVVHGYLFGQNTGRAKTMVLESAERLLLPQTDLILTMNQWDWEWTREHFPSVPLEQIPGMGVREERFDGLTRNKRRDGSFVMVYPAEFSKRKNQELLIRSMLLLPQEARLILPGDGALRENCIRLAQSIGVGERVSFPGHLPDLRDVFAQADAAVSSSRSEGLPFNLMEAMLCGLPVIASDVKGNADLVKEGVTGFIFPDQDQQAFAGAAKRLMENPDEREKMGCEGRKKAQQFCLGRVLPAVMSAYLGFEGGKHLDKTRERRVCGAL